jgi:hypothetical protein
MTKRTPSLHSGRSRANGSRSFGGILRTGSLGNSRTGSDFGFFGESSLDKATIAGAATTLLRISAITASRLGWVNYVSRTWQM